MGGHSRQRCYYLGDTILWINWILHSLLGKEMGTNMFLSTHQHPWFLQPCWTSVYVIALNSYGTELKQRIESWEITSAFVPSFLKRKESCWYISQGATFIIQDPGVPKWKSRWRDSVHVHAWHLETWCQILLCFGGWPVHCRMFSSPCLRVANIYVHGWGLEGREELG